MSEKKNGRLKYDKISRYSRYRISYDRVEFVVFMTPDEIANPSGWSDELTSCTLLNKIEISCHAFHSHLVALYMIEVGVHQRYEAREVIWGDDGRKKVRYIDQVYADVRTSTHLLFQS